jgi:hypothetical protein
MEYLGHFQEIRQALEADRRGQTPVAKARRTRDARNLALGHLHSALEDLQQALKQTEDPLSGELVRNLEWSFDSSFGGSPFHHHFRQFRAYVDRAIPVVAKLKAGKRGRPREKARDSLDREVVRAVYDAGLLRPAGRGRRSVLYAVLLIVYAYCGYPPPDEQSPGVRKALKQFEALRQAETTGRVSDFRKTASFTTNHYGEK